MTHRPRALIAALLLLAPASARAQERPEVLTPETFTGLTFRSIGPAATSGRISEIAVDPTRSSTWYVAVSSGGVWKTENAGTTFEPIFDGEGSYSIGCVAIDPNDPLTVWVGTGENNNQRSVAYGDGVYKSVDGGAHWKRVGLEASEHVARILVDPRDSDVVFVAAQGPLWSAGGDRGLHKTEDGGGTWSRVLEISEHTGVSDAWLEPGNADVIYAAAHQRRRHVWTYLGGGPESAIYKSTDAGSTWRKLENGLPKGDKGRIGLAVSPVAPRLVYAMVEAEEGGFYRSSDGGENWEKRSDHATSGNYYVELVPDPRDVDRVYSMDTFMHVTEDGGESFHRAGQTDRHVDDHALWIDPENTDHLLAGCDGGVYESWDRAATWDFKANLPVTQFYKLEVDDAEPFYNVYGGTQDNFTLGGPSRTVNDHGIANADWIVTASGDGFQPRVDPEDPDTVYSQAQYGELVRHDRRTGEMVDIKPQEEPGDDPLRWNWDAPLIISPHSHTRLYFGAQRLFRSDDRGGSWTPVSGDLTRQIDRNQLKVMGRIWSVDAVAKNESTSPYGNLVALDESPLVEGLLYVGSDDGLVHVSEDGGGSWRRVETFPGVPERTYVNDVVASRHSADVVYSVFNNHKRGDFTPYARRSADRGRSWQAIASDLPERGSVYALVEDPAKPELLFAGTEFGVFFSIDTGASWTRLKGGVPTIAVRDLAIQEREGDLVLGTFGRGFYVLDDYTALRHVTRERLEQEAALFPVRRAYMFATAYPLGFPGKSFQGASFYAAPNPPYGAVFTYHLKEDLRSLGDARRESEAETAKSGGDTPYPSWERLREEDAEADPEIVLTVRDEDGGVVRHLAGPTQAGFQRVAWDLRYPPPEPVDLSPGERMPWQSPPRGPLAAPGRYSVELQKRVRGELTALGEPQRFEVVPLSAARLPEADRVELLAFQRKAGRLYRALLGAVEAAGEAQGRIEHLRAALVATPGADSAWRGELDGIEARLRRVTERLSGDETRASRSEPTPPSLEERLSRVVGDHWARTTAPTGTQERAYAIVAEEFPAVLEELRSVVETELRGLEERAEAAGAPWTPGRVPRWEPEG